MGAVMLCAVLLLLVATPVLAQDGGRGGGEVLLGQDLHLQTGEAIVGDTVILGGSLDMDEGSRIEGDVVIFGGRVTVDGEITGDLAAIGGGVHLRSHATVGGDVVAVGGSLDRDEGAAVAGKAVQTDRFHFEDMALTLPDNFRPGPDQRPSSSGIDLLGTLLHIIRAVTLAVVLGVMGMLVALLLPKHTQVVSQTILDASWTSFGVGLLTLVVALTVTIFLIVTICLSPVGLLLVLALVVAILFGWVVIGYVLGQRLILLLKKEEATSPLLSAFAGVFLLTLLQQGLMVLGAIPCLGVLFWLLGAGLWLVATATGLGAVVLSRFGTQRYIVLHPHRETPTALPPQPAPPSDTETAGDNVGGIEPDLTSPGNEDESQAADDVESGE